jgi:hypothetical protein
MEFLAIRESKLGNFDIGASVLVELVDVLRLDFNVFVLPNLISVL